MPVAAALQSKVHLQKYAAKIALLLRDLRLSQPCFIPFLSEVEKDLTQNHRRRCYSSGREKPDRPVNKWAR
jgi:hypothetical protein